MRRATLLLVLAGAGCARPPNLPTIVRGEIARTVTKGQGVVCERRRDAQVVAWDCFQRFTSNDQHFTALSIEVRAAAGVLPDSRTRLVSLSFGPGGSGSRFEGRTRDGKYDVLASEMSTGVSDGDQPMLPGGADLINRVLATYDRAIH